MITVYVWIPNTTLSLGHASMKVARDYTPDELKEIKKDFPGFMPYHETYISWWPVDKGYMVPWGKSFLDGVAHTYQEDVSNAYEAREPEWSTNIYDLDEAAIETAWLAFKYNSAKQNWHAVQNCSTIVGRLLRLGGGYFFLGNNAIWTPRQVMHYAAQITANESVCRLR